MTLEHFEKGLQNNNGVQISKRYTIWNDYQLIDDETGIWTPYENLQALVDANPDVKKIIEESDDFILQWD